MLCFARPILVSEIATQKLFENTEAITRPADNEVTKATTKVDSMQKTSGTGENLTPNISGEGEKQTPTPAVINQGMLMHTQIIKCIFCT